MRSSHRVSQALRLLVLVCALALTLSRPSHAESMPVPAAAQAELIAKLVGFDRNFTARAGGKAVIIIVAMAGDAESMSAALEVKAAFARLPTVGNLPHEEVIVTYSNAAALAQSVRSKRAALVYLGPGFDKQISAIRDALSSLDVLSVAAIPGYVPAGIVLGFDLVSGRPKLLIQVVQARKQNVAFPASVLSLMKVYQ
jgi:hypothetical protein